MKKVAAGLSVGIAVAVGSVILLVVSLLGVVLFAFGFHQFSTSSEPTRVSVGGMSNVAIKNYWLSQEGVNSYELTVKDWGPKDTLGGNRYLVDYSLTVEIDEAYTTGDPEELFKQALASLWYSKDKAPEGLITFALHIPGMEPINWQPIVREVFGDAVEVSPKPSRAVGFRSDSDTFEDALGPWTAGPAPKLPGLIRERSADNPEDAIVAVPGLDEKSNLKIRAQKGSLNGEIIYMTCVFFYGIYGVNDDLGSVYDSPVELTIYSSGEVLKTLTLESSDLEPRFEASVFRECYQEQWPMETISGKLTWPAARGFSGGSEDAIIASE